MSIFVQWENNKTPLNAENLNVINDVARQLGEDVAHLSDVVVDIDENFSAKVQNELTEVKSSINTINETTSRLQQQTSSNNTNITNIQRTIADNNSALEEKINTNKNNLTTLQNVVNDNKTELDGKITTNKNNLNTLQQNVNNINSTLDNKITVNKNKLDNLEQNINNVNSTLDGKIATNKDSISNIQNSLLTGQYTSYSGTNLTCNDTLSSKTSNMVIKGKTYQNLIQEKSYLDWYTRYCGRVDATGVYIGKGEKYANQSPDQINYTNSTDVKCHVLTKSNTVYTLIFDANILEGKSSTYNIEYNGIRNYGASPIKNGRNTIKITSDDNQNGTFQIFSVGGEDSNINIKLTNIIILEGDWTNKEIPSSITGIESVGDKEGNKISILSHGKNLCPINKISIKQARYVITKTPIKLKPNTYYSVSSNAQLNVLVTNTLVEPVPVEWNQDTLFSHIVTGNKGYEYGTSEQGQNSFLNSNWKYAYITTWIKNDNGVDIENLMFCEGQNDFDFVPYKEDKKEILLPLDGGLKSLPDGVADIIEQREDGVYLVQRVKRIVLNGSENWELEHTGENTYLYALNIDKNYIARGGNESLCSHYKYLDALWKTDAEHDVVAYDLAGNTRLNIRELKSKIGTTNQLENFKNMLKNDNIILYCELATPIETKLDTKDINVETFDDLTYVLTNNNIQPELEFKIPSNLGALIQNNAKKINELFKLIDELIIPQLTTNTSNIAVLQITK